jgi:hypothetical protein
MSISPQAGRNLPRVQHCGSLFGYPPYGWKERCAIGVWRGCLSGRPDDERAARLEPGYLRSIIVLKEAHIKIEQFCSVACYILRELLLPEICVCFRHSGIFTPFVTVPETAVHKDRYFVLRKYNIRFSWQICSM